MNYAHTPGPWLVSKYGSGFEVITLDGACVAQAQQVKPARTAKDHDEWKANARLIAYAPALIEALARIELAASAAVCNKDWIAEHARAAIAKATGEAA